MDFSQYRFKTEMHAHTKPVSPCSEIAPALLVEQYAELGYQSVMITNHFYPGMAHFGEKEACLEAYLADYTIAKAVGDRLGVHVLLGCEIRFAENSNDYLLFGVTPQLLADAYETLDKDLETFSKKFRSEDLLIFQAHPFRDGMFLADPANLDGVETFNMHPGHNSRVAVAARYAREHDFLVSAGTDYHHMGHAGMAGILTKTPLQTAKDVVAVLKNRDYLLDVGGNVILPYPEQSL